MKEAVIPKYATNIVLAFLGAVVLAHSMVHFGRGELPEAVLALLLFLKAFTKRRQPWILVAVGIVSIAVTWIVNTSSATPFRTALSWLAIAGFAVIAFSRYVFKYSQINSVGSG